MAGQRFWSGGSLAGLLSGGRGPDTHGKDRRPYPKPRTTDIGPDDQYGRTGRPGVEALLQNRKDGRKHSRRTRP